MRPRSMRDWEDEDRAQLEHHQRLAAPQSGETRIGTVARVKLEAGFAFVHVDGERGDYFLHFTALQDGVELKDLQPGVTKGEFIVNITAKGPRCEQFKVL